MDCDKWGETNAKMFEWGEMKCYQFLAKWIDPLRKLPKDAFVEVHQHPGYREPGGSAREIYESLPNPFNLGKEMSEMAITK